MTKREIRKEILKKLKTQNSKLKVEKDKLIRNKVLSLKEFKEANVIAFYISLKTEVNTRLLIDDALKKGKRVVVPVVVGDDLEFQEIEYYGGFSRGPYGVLQPIRDDNKLFPKNKIDVIIVPGVAFDTKGARLGRGKGFYDRFLKGLSPRAKKIGLAYDLQIVEKLPTTPHDIPVDIVITN